MEQVQHNYENYLNVLMSESTLPQELVSKVSKWKEVKATKVDVSKSKVEKGKMKVDTSPFIYYISMPKTDETDLIDKIKTQVLCEEQYNKNWYIDSGGSRHMTSHKENLSVFRKLENAGVVKFGNNHKCKFKGYKKVKNGVFIVNMVAYVGALEYNLISVTQLVVGTGNQVLFYVEGGVILNKETKEVLLKSKRKGDMFTLDIKPIAGIPSVCQLSKDTFNLSWL
uniref:Retrovirus-related Pol polyprotein from transposon TNT 1-94-like beta-barrel domain-containing protein n=1 Tax=Lactuca sativa TaxID=4236 RepID=A0A9R1UKU8_LACSA|nr:hypothetical protein LSAT_V11C800433500 [Lactuca sativa]